MLSQAEKWAKIVVVDDMIIDYTASRTRKESFDLKFISDSIFGNL